MEREGNDARHNQLRASTPEESQMDRTTADRPFPPHIRVHRTPTAATTSRTRLTGPDDAARVLQPILCVEEVELFLALHLDARSQIIAYTEITRGLVDASLVHPREVFRAAIAAGASGIIVAHNHPSGDPTPSPEDRAVTRRLVAAGELLDIPIHDHLIIAGERYLSFATAGLL